MRGQQPVMRVNKTRETVEIPHRGDKLDVIVKERRSMRDLKDSTPRNGLKWVTKGDKLLLEREEKGRNLLYLLNACLLL